MKKSRTHYSVLNILTGIGGYILNTVIGLVCRMVFTRTLSADYLGISGLFTNILTMLSLAELGIGSAIVYALYKPLAVDDKDKIASLVHFFGKCYRIIGIVVAVIGFSLAPFLHFIIGEEPNIHENIYLIYCLYIFNTSSTYFFSYRITLIQAAQQNYIVTGVNYLITILQSSAQIVWLLLTHNYLGYLIIQIISVFIYNIIMSVVAKKKYPYIARKNFKPLEKSDKKTLFKNVKALVIIKLSGLLVNSTDNIIISFFSGLATVGLSSNYTLLSTTLNSLLNQIFTGITASVGNLNALENKEKSISVFYSINLANFWLFGWSSIGIFVLSNDLVSLMFGEDYVLPFSIPLILAINYYLVGMQSAVWTFKNTMGIFRPGRYLLILTAILNLGLSLLLGKIWGLFGILLATAISRMLTNIWYDPYAVFKYGFDEKVNKYYKKYGVYFIVLILTGLLCWDLCGLIHTYLWLNIVLKFIICCIVPNLIFYLIFRRTKDLLFFKDLARNFAMQIKNKFKGTN